MSLFESISAKLKLATQELEMLSNETLVTEEQNPPHPGLLIEIWFNQLNGTCDRGPTIEKNVLIIFYALIIIISLFGNSIVCKIVFGNSAAKSTTNLFIGNLSISDLMMTVINIPLTLTRILSQNWPLGIVLCKCMPFFQALSVNVSILTMTLIAYDRYQVIAYPLKPRPRFCKTIIKLAMVWITAMALSSPYPLMSKLIQGVSCARFVRCQLVYPIPRVEFRKVFSICASLIQYVLPLTYCAIIYLKLCLIIWHRRAIGVVTKHQKEHLQKEKWKTIKMLIIVLIVFAVCWLPLNVYHAYQDIRGEVGYEKHKSNISLICHWFAMSSVCYNPFIYCWLNDTFRKVAVAQFKWIWEICKMKSLHSAPNWDREVIKTSLTRSRNTSIFSKGSSLTSNPQDSYYCIIDTRNPNLNAKDFKSLQDDDTQTEKIVDVGKKSKSYEGCDSKQINSKEKKSVKRWYKEKGYSESFV